jgi:hypothetical protein
MLTLNFSSFAAETYMLIFARHFTQTSIILTKESIENFKKKNFYLVFPKFSVQPEHMDKGCPNWSSASLARARYVPSPGAHTSPVLITPLGMVQVGSPL